ncbi:MAG: RNA-binding S4 domain-containing protein [Oscillospiraceae bacterium]|nr:RNA-binding S4 domain-containing protein [Candidatus Equicaccousia limihippi]
MTVKIKEDYIKLDSLLKLANTVSSGGEAKMLIQNGKISVNGEVCLMRGKKIREGDIVVFEDTEITVTKI